MRVAVVSNLSIRSYLLNVFAAHPEFPAEIVSFPVWKKADCKEYCGIPLTTLGELDACGYDCILIAVSNTVRQAEVLEYLHNICAHDVFILRQTTLNKQWDFLTSHGFDMTRVNRFPENDKAYMAYMEAHVCDYCNLNCSACEHFCPFVKQRRVADIGQYEADMAHLSTILDNIGVFRLLGGEPLLEPALCCEMMRVTRACFPNTELHIVTNGTTLLNLPAFFFERARETGAQIDISLYPPILSQRHEIESKLRSERLVFWMSPPIRTFTRLLSRSETWDADYNNHYCPASGCHLWRNGFLGKCPLTLLMDYFAPQIGREAAEMTGGDAVRVLDERDGWSLVHKMNSPCYMCRMCAVEAQNPIEWRIAGTNPVVSDWFV